MKIGIVTYVKTATCNYGAELQAFALQYKLNQNGYDAEVLNLKRELPGNARFLDTVKKAIKARFAKLNFFSAIISVVKLFIAVAHDKYNSKKFFVQNQKKKQLYGKFFDEYIRHSDTEYRPEDMDKVELPYDTYIAGSDQIWNYKNSDRVDVFFLMFANRFNAKKISYAASFSISSIPNNLRERYTQWINNIEYISVRESEGVSIVKELTGRDATMVCDPTLLLDKNEWKKAFEDSKIEIPNEKYVFIYTMSRSKNVFRIAKEIAHRLGDIKIIHVRLGVGPDINDGIDHLNYATPPEWAYLLMNASYVVTDSFHGTAFSINFRKPFTVIQNPMSDLNSRVNTILTKVGLKDRIYVDNKSGHLPVNLEVNYNNVGTIIDEWRDYSWNFLINSLNR